MQACILASTLQVFRRKCPLDERKTRRREPAPSPLIVRMPPKRKAVISRSRVSLQGPAPIQLVTTVTQFLSAVLVSRRIANLDRSNTHSDSSEFDYGAIPHVEHFGKIRFRTISGLCLPCRFICATWRLSGNTQHANDNRFERGAKMLPRRPCYRSRACRICSFRWCLSRPTEYHRWAGSLAL
jgi:hypothetical protein